MAIFFPFVVLSPMDPRVVEPRGPAVEPQLCCVGYTVPNSVATGFGGRNSFDTFGVHGISFQPAMVGRLSLKARLTPPLPPLGPVEESRPLPLPGGATLGGTQDPQRSTYSFQHLVPIFFGILTSFCSKKAQNGILADFGAILF